MHAVQLFSHRPPSSTIHLLNDPLPERWSADVTALFSRKETLSARQAHIAASGRVRATSAKKK